MLQVGEVMGFSLFRATGLAFAIRPKDGIQSSVHPRAFQRTSYYFTNDDDGKMTLLGERRGFVTLRV